MSLLEQLLGIEETCEQLWVEASEKLSAGDITQDRYDQIRDHMHTAAYAVETYLTDHRDEATDRQLEIMGLTTQPVDNVINCWDADGGWIG